MSSARKAFDVRHPLFRPLWRRALFVGLLLAWIAYELAQGNWYWAAGFGAATAYLIYEWFLVFDPANYSDKDDGA